MNDQKKNVDPKPSDTDIWETNDVFFPEVVTNESECSNCGYLMKENQNFCPSCGYEKNTSAERENIVRCRKCNSSQIEFVTYQGGTEYEAGKGCCGYLLCGPIGLLFGVKNKGPAKTVRKCKNCGEEF